MLIASSKAFILTSLVFLTVSCDMIFTLQGVMIGPADAARSDTVIIAFRRDFYKTYGVNEKAKKLVKWFVFIVLKGTTRTVSLNYQI
ncbi:hypothetical protein AGMMS49944_20750 [Spirochaetia bacterium]|nr:hypothetical protein AGMMS49944_20750 [Spirochaetia bacterium]